MDIRSERIAGIKAALKAGATREQIADHMAKKQGVDIAAAREAGATDDDIIAHLVQVQPGKRQNPYAKALQETNPAMRGMVNIGSGMAGLATGARQLVGADMSPADQQNLEAGEYLASQPGGTVGRIVGQALPFAAIPAGAAGQAVGRGLQGAGMAANAGRVVNAGTAIAASPMADLALLGAGAGAVMPTTKAGERSVNTLIGAAAGPAVMAAGRVLGGIAEAGRAWLNPEDVAAQGILRAATDPAKVRAMQGTGEIIPGSVPTTATATGDAGLLAMERRMRSTNVSDFSPVDEAAAKARNEALAKIAKTPQELADAKLARAGNEAVFYRDALPQTAVTQTAELAALSSRPVVKQAFAQAVKDAANLGMKFGSNGQLSGTDMHMVKMALDDALQRASSTTTPQGQNAARAVKAARDEFVKYMDSNVPGYQQARQQYAQASQPIREMESAQSIQQQLREKGGKMASGADAPTPLQFERAVRSVADSDFGSNFSAPAQKVLDDIAADIRRSDLVNAKNVRGLGSDTFQKFASQNVADKMLGGNSALARRVQNLPLFAGRNDEVSQMMVRAIVDPKYAKYIISKLPTARDQSNMMKLIQSATKSAAVAAAPAIKKEVMQ